MAVKLRLRRMGKKRQPVYKVVAADARAPRDGRFIEAIGLYNPKTDPATIEISEERALYWLNVGAQPTTTVRNILSKEGILLKFDMTKRGKSEEEINAKVEELKKLHEAKLAKKAEEKAKAKAKPVAKEEPKAEPEEKVEKEEISAEEAQGTASEEVKAEDGKTE